MIRTTEITETLDNIDQAINDFQNSDTMSIREIRRLEVKQVCLKGVMVTYITVLVTYEDYKG